MCFMLGLTKEFFLGKKLSRLVRSDFSFFISIMADGCRPFDFYTLKRKCMMSPS